MTQPKLTFTVTFDEWVSREQYAAGNQQALGELWKKHARWLAFYALKYARENHEVADEAMGELGLKLARREIMRLYRPTESWRYWTRSILRNIIRDYMRKKYRPNFVLTKKKLKRLLDDGIEPGIIDRLEPLAGKPFWDEFTFRRAVGKLMTSEELQAAWLTILERARSGQFRDTSLPEQEVPHNNPATPPDEMAAWSEFREILQLLLDELPSELRAIFIMHTSWNWPFIRIAEVLHGKQDANLVSRPFYKAKDFLKCRMKSYGQPGGQAGYTQCQTPA